MAGFSGPFDHPLGRFDRRLWRLQDRVLAGWAEGREGLAEILVVGIFGRDHQAVSPGKLLREDLALRGELGYPSAEVGDLLVWRQRKLGPLGFGDRLRFC